MITVLLWISMRISNTYLLYQWICFLTDEHCGHFQPCIFIWNLVNKHKTLNFISSDPDIFLNQTL